MQDQNGKITAELETAIKRRDFPEVPAYTDGSASRESIFWFPTEAHGAV
jgi:hypothetical protein